MAMQCPKCKINLDNQLTKTTESNQIKRTKVCPQCKTRYRTIEILVDDYNSMANFFNGFVELIQRYSK